MAQPLERGYASVVYACLAHFRMKTDFARSKFVEALQNYQQVERDYRARYKQRVERQFRIGGFYCDAWPILYLQSCSQT